MKRSRLSAFEKGKAVPPPATLGRLAEVLGVTVPEIHALADLLGVAPELLDRTADPAGHQAIGAAARWATLLRGAEPALLPFTLPLTICGAQPAQMLDAEADDEAAALWARLKPYSAAERRAIVQENEEFQVWGLSRLLCDESLEAASDDPAVALELARLAELVAALVPGSAAFRSRLAGYCAFHGSSALRVGGSLPAAGEDLQRAETLWSAGAAGDPEQRFPEARTLGLKASLLREQRHLVEALDLLDQAYKVARTGEAKFLLLNRANTLEDLGRYEEAIATLHLLLPNIDADREPRLLLIQRFNLSVNFCRLGRFAEADRRLGELEELAQKVAKGVARIRIAWLHGWIAAGMGRLEEAEAALGAVREEFLVRDIGYDAALASLDLAKLYLQQGRTAEVKHLAGQMVKVFQEQGVHREALAAVQLFQVAAERERASLELVSRLAEFLRRARHEAGLRFPG
jgi:tetratricopeptide (TPR) repeat protein